MSLLINPNSSNRNISEIYLGLSDGNHQIIKGYIGTSSGNRIFYEKVTIPDPIYTTCPCCGLSEGDYVDGSNEFNNLILYCPTCGMNTMFYTHYMYDMGDSTRYCDYIGWCSICQTLICDQEDNLDYESRKITVQSQTCSDCGESLGTIWYCNHCDSIVAYNVVSDHECEEECSHNWITYSDTATCTSDGIKYQDCKYCGETRSLYSAAKGHAYTSTYCPHGKLMSHICTRCGYNDGACEYCDDCATCDHSMGGDRTEIICPDCQEIIYSKWVCDGCGLTEVWDGSSDHTCSDVCLMKNTKILMADNTEKPIEEVVEGDLVRSYDIINNEHVNTRVIRNVTTGISDEWMIYHFKDGELPIYDKHNIYCNEKQSVYSSIHWVEGLNSINSNGEITPYIYTEVINTVCKVPRYYLITENNLYFANNILCGHHPRRKYELYEKGIIKNVSNEDLEQYKKTYSIYEEADGKNNSEFLEETQELRSKIKRARDSADKKKKAILINRTLNNSEKFKERNKDKYKHTSTAKLKTSKANYIAEAKKYTQELNKVKEKYGIKVKNKQECWLEAYKLDMEYIKNKT